MTTAFDRLQSDKQLQEHWLRRVVAFIIDAIIIYIVFWILTFWISFGFLFFGSFAWLFLDSFLWGAIFLLYSGILEGIRGATIGKELLKLRVIKRAGSMDIGKGLVRNVSKIHWLFILLDLLLGFFTPGEPRQRYLDRITDTIVEDLPVTR